MAFPRSLAPLLAAGLLTLTVSAQQKELTLKDAVLKAGTDLAPQRLSGLQWIPNTETYCYVKNDTLLRAGVGKMAEVPLFSLKRLNEELKRKEPLKRLPPITWTGADLLYFDVDSVTYQYDLSKQALLQHMALPGDAENQDHDERYTQVAYTRGNDLYIHTNREREHTIRVTTDGADGIVNGASNVHRNEYGVEKGTFWSPQGDLLAFYRLDETMVTKYQLEDISTKPSTFNAIRYPMAGQTSHHATIGVFDTRTQRTVFLNTGEPKDQYLTNVAWSPDQKSIFVVHLNRATDHLRVVQYDAATGKVVKQVLEERDPKWLEPMHPMRFLKSDPDKFIWWSQRDGFPHLYLYSLSKGLVRPLTSGNWVVKHVVGLDAKERQLFVEGTAMIDPKDPRGATETHLYRIDIGSGKSMRLTSDIGTHAAQVSTSGALFIDAWSSLKVPGRVDLRETVGGKLMRTLLTSTDPLAAYKVGAIELLTIPGENGDVLNARLVKPSSFDAKRKYPVLVYTYNGPHVQLVTNSFLGGASHWMLEAAERGYLVFTVDGHGSDNRGRDFEQAIHRRLGEVEVKDQLRGVEYLKGLPYVDDKRLAVHGWSFGGFMTTSLMVKAPGTFAVGVAGGPVMDWSMYEVMYTERYMDTPQENPDGYATSALPDKCDKLAGKLLLIHGGIDNVVLPEHSYAFIKNSVSKGVQLDFFVYPGHEHNVRGRDRLHLMTKVLDYVDGAIKPLR
ncbi:MAG: DPP IV N-terminal domain-containing protein [Flavobacteriales bacterium]|nr:DPP IV N-terminal domain-containing protein [Flavobacteriales bacterium]